MLTGIKRIAAKTRLLLHNRVASSQFYGPSFAGLASGTLKLALTYDDGPNDPHTLRLLEVLEKHGVYATFFLIGQSVVARPKIARSIVEAGHAVGNHTYSHPDLTELSPSQLSSELDRANCAIEDVTGVRPKLFRPPFGRRNRRILSTARKLEMTTVMWRVACYDWKAESHESIVNTIIPLIAGGEVLLFHDGSHLNLAVDRANCVEATDEILRHFRNAGYQFVTVPQMISGAVESEVREEVLVG
jgi:peptidoglycan/xylan/chitin deacetylase (PgdA/CDA1 family)